MTNILLLYRKVDALSHLISWHQRGGFCHCATAICVSVHGVHGVIEATWPKVRWREMEKVVRLGKREGLAAGIEYECAFPAAAIVFAGGQFGKGYDLPAIASFLSRSSRAQRKQRARWTCSELGLVLSEISGNPLLVTDKPHMVSPEHLSWTPKGRRVTVGELRERFL
jgi:hypothetical protein